MTSNSRQHFWPRRWMRSFIGAGMATSFVGGAIWAADPLFEQQTPKDAPKIELPKVEVPKVEVPSLTPKPPAKPVVKEKLVTFAMSDKPWAKVIEWYAAETGLAFLSTEKAPDGTFNFIPPKTSTGEARKYTLSEVTDVINEGLMSKNFVLIRGEQSFRLWPADQPIDPVLVRRVTLEELKTLGGKDIVQVVLVLKTASAEDMRDDVKKMLSKSSEVVVLRHRNALVMIDTAANLRRVVNDLESNQDVEDGNSAEQMSHKCVYVRARDAATAMRELLRTADTSTTPLFQPGMMGSFGFGGFGGGPGAGFGGGPSGGFGGGPGGGFGGFSGGNFRGDRG
ncbi:hypothetical protein, partial [Zavarzinella formosa]|uniref:hypothetical protein n=1 Tax=Zavarzinella formosa TaxID=360055 RepID=UPI001EE64558